MRGNLGYLSSLPTTRAVLQEPNIPFARVQFVCFNYVTCDPWTT